MSDQEDTKPMLESTWTAINPNTYPAVLKINAQFHVDEDGIDNVVDARDEQGRCHMMTESQLATLYVREGELPQAVIDEPAPVEEIVVEETAPEVETVVEAEPEAAIEEILVEEEVVLETDEEAVLEEAVLEEAVLEEAVLEEAEPEVLEEAEPEAEEPTEEAAPKAKPE